MIMLIAVFLKYGVSEFSHVLLATLFVDLYEVVDRKHEPRSIEMEPIINKASNIHNGDSTLS